MTHLKREEAPKFWPIKRKEKTFVVRPRPCSHPLKESIPLVIVVRDILNLAETRKEAMKVIKSGNVLVDKKIRKDPNFSVGLMDIVEFSLIKKFYRVVPRKRGLSLIEVEDDADKKLCKIENKKTLKKGIMQINLHDGKNIITENDTYKTGDSVVIELPSQKILDHIKLDKGNLVLISGGKNVGQVGIVNELIETKISKTHTEGIRQLRQPNKAILEIGKIKTETQERFIFVIGKNEPAISLGVHYERA